MARKSRNVPKVLLLSATLIVALAAAPPHGHRITRTVRSR